MDEVETQLKDFPRANKKPKVFDQALLDKINPDFEQGMSYLFDTGLRNHKVSVLYTWVFEDEPYSTSTLALIRVMESLSQHLFDVFRRDGLGYLCSANSTNLGHRMRLAILRLDIPKIDDSVHFGETYFRTIVSDVFGSLDNSELDFIVDLERRRQEALSVSPRDRLFQFYEGLTAVGKAFDSDVICQRYSSITIQDLKTWKDKFLSTMPAVFIAGDLS